ncbi:MAG: hypothetical protein ACXQTZ_00710 [Candidatus Alkanophagales archaeon]
MALEYRSRGEVISPDDHNVLVDVAKSLLDDIATVDDIVEKGGEWSEADAMVVESLIEEMKRAISRMRYVAYGDYVLADDHNSLVDFAKAALEAIRIMKEKVRIPAPPPPNYVFLNLPAAISSTSAPEPSRTTKLPLGEISVSHEIKESA